MGKSWEKAGNVKIWDFVIITPHCIQDIFVHCIELVRLSDPTMSFSEININFIGTPSQLRDASLGLDFPLLVPQIQDINSSCYLTPC